MDLADQKKRIIEQVLHLEDEETLNQLEDVLSQPNWEWEDLDEQVKASILRGLEQAKRGEVIPHAEVVKMFPKWLTI